MPPAGAGLPGMLRGSLVHQLLERVDFRRPVAPHDDGGRASALGARRRAVPEHVADLRGMVEGFLGRRAGRAPGGRGACGPSASSRSSSAGLLVNGVVDVHAEEDDGLLIVDYKSDPLEGVDPAALVAERYATQRLVYALAGLRDGAGRVEVAYSFLERPADPVTAAFEAADADSLAGELTDLARGRARRRVRAHRPAPPRPVRGLPGPCVAVHLGRGHDAARATVPGVRKLGGALAVLLLAAVAIFVIGELTETDEDADEPSATVPGGTAPERHVAQHDAGA